MANKKISELNPITSASLSPNDLFVVVDVDAPTTPTGETKKVQLDELSSRILSDFNGTASYFDLITVVGTNALDVGGMSDSTPGSNSVQIHKSQATGTGAISIGYNASASFANSISIGEDASSDVGSISIGKSSDSGNYAIAIGDQSVATFNSSISIGREAASFESSNIAIGSFTSASFLHSISMGYSSVANGLYSLAIGSQSSGSGARSISIGRESAAGQDSVAVGNNAKSLSTQAITIGRNTSAGPDSVAIGDTASATTSSVAIGQFASSGINGTAIGNASLCTNGFAIGSSLSTPDDVGEIGLLNSGFLNGPRTSIRFCRATSSFDGFLNFAIQNKATPYVTSSAAQFGEAATEMMPESFSIRRNGDALFIDVNIGGVVKTLSLGTAT
jgi:trimeric autotransporter adhesin